MAKKTVILLMCCFFFVATAGTGEKYLDVFVEELPPLYFLGKNKKWHGIEVDVIMAVCNRAGFTPRFVSMSWARGLESIKVGRIQLMGSLTWRKERTEFIDFIGRSRFERMTLLVHEDNLNKEIHSVEELAELPSAIGITRGAYYPNLTEYLQENPEQKKKFEITTTAFHSLKKVQHKRLFGVIDDISLGTYAMRITPGLGSIRIHDYALSKGNWVYMGASLTMPKDDRDALRKAYTQLNKEGKITEILLKWGVPNSMATPPVGDE